MHKTTDNLLLKYWDKALLLVLAVIVLFVFFTKVLSSPIEAAGQNGAGNLAEKLTDDAARLKLRLAAPAGDSADDPDSFSSDLDVLVGYQGDLPETPLVPFPPGDDVELALAKIATPDVLAPLALQVQTSLGIPALTSTAPTSIAAPASQQQMHWVTVAAKFPFRRQYEIFADLDPAVVPENEVHLMFVRLELQREQLQPDGSWSEPVSVNPYELYKELLPAAVEALGNPYSLDRRQEDMQDREVFRAWLAAAGFQEFIARPEFLPLTSFEQWIWPQQLPTSDEDLPATPEKLLAGKIPNDSAPKYRLLTVDGATPSRTTRRTTGYQPPAPVTGFGGFPAQGANPYAANPYATPGYQPGPTTPTATYRRTSSRRSGERVEIPRTYDPKTVYDSGQAPDNVDIWAHDASAEPGKVYRYRMRVLLSNPLCGKEEAETRTVRRQSWLTGQWSGWSDPIRVLQDREFFFTAVRQVGSRDPAARVEVFAWHQGWWYSYHFNCSKPGEEIGKPKRVQEYVLSQSTRTLSRDESPGPPAKVDVDFFTGWEVVKFTPKVEVELPVPDQPGQTEIVEAAELLARQVGTDLTVTKYYAKDREEDPLMLRLEAIVERQDEATEEPNPRSNRPPRTGNTGRNDRGIPANPFGNPYR